MGYKEKFNGSTDKTINVGGTDEKTGKPHPKSIEGYFLGSKDTVSDYGPGKLHIFQTPEGNVGVWGKTRSNQLLTAELVGQMVKLEFTGMITPSKKGRRPSYGYKLFHDDANTIDTTGINVNEASDETSEPAEDYEEQSLDADDEPLDEIAPVRAAPARRPAAPVNNERAAKIQAMLGNRTKA